MAACLEHLGRLPSELDLGDEQIKELLAFHRIQRRSQNVCPVCIKESRDQEKKCFICSRKFTDEHGVVRERGDRKADKLDGSSSAILKMLKDKHEPKLKDAPEEVQDEKRKKWLAWAKEHGVKIRESK